MSLANRTWRLSLVSALVLVVATALGPTTSIPTASAQAVAPPLLAEDLGSDWALAIERWFVPPEGVGNYSSAFQRDPMQGLSSNGPITVTIGVDMLPDTPPADAIDQNLNAFLSFATPEGQAQVFDTPDLGTPTKWYSFPVDLTPALPEGSTVPPGIAYGAVFQNGNNVINMTAVGFADQLRFDDALSIARTVAQRMPGFRLTAEAAQ